MMISLDTHVLLWWLNDPRLLSNATRKAIDDGKNPVYVSAAVAWEIAIKQALVKLDAPDDLEAAMAANRCRDPSPHRSEYSYPHSPPDPAHAQEVPDETHCRQDPPDHGP
jgi:PIN domain nuclease of toxin-antitoxin system